MNFKQALNELIGGKKIRRKNWETEFYWVLDNKGYLVDFIGMSPFVKRSDILEQNNWEVYYNEQEELIKKLKEIQDELDYVKKKLKEQKE